MDFFLQHKTIVRVSVIIVVFGIAGGARFFFWQKFAQTTRTIVSEDGQFTLSARPADLPGDVSIDAVSVALLMPDAYPDEVKVLQPLVVYRLEPSGVVFTQPVSFTMTIPSDLTPAWPLAVLVSENGYEPVKNLKVTREENGLFELTGEIQHFSFVAGISGFVEATMPKSLGRYRVGESFSAPVTFRVTDRVNSAEGDAYWQLSARPTFSKPGLFLGDKIFDPQEINTPAEGTELSGATTDIAATFTCKAPGYGRISFVGGLGYYYEFYMTGLLRPLNVLDYLNPDEYGGISVILRSTAECYEVNESELYSLLQFDATPYCDGRVEVRGKLQHEQVRGLLFEVLPKGEIVSQSFDVGSGDFQLTLRVPVGQSYRLNIHAITQSGDKLFVSDPGFTVFKCPERDTSPRENPPPPDTTQPPIQDALPLSDDTPDTEDDTTGGDDDVDALPPDTGDASPPPEDPTPSTSNDCNASPGVYGFPVYGGAMPSGCKPTDDRPGWDCYTFEEPACSPSTRCFCITPPESL